MTRRRVWIWVSTATLALTALAAVGFVSVVPLRSETLRQRIVATLSDRLNSNVELGDLSLRVLPGLHVEGKELVIRQREHVDQPALIAIKSFTVDADPIGLWRRHVAHVDVAGLVISIPPHDDDDKETTDDRPPHRLHAGTEAPALPVAANDAPRSDASGDVVIDTLDANGTQLIIVPRERAKPPKVWAIHSLRMHTVGAVTSSPYEATLTNGVPPGEIVTSGNFGPWNRDDPGNTPLGGTYTFDNADLGVFKGIGGTLSSRGSFIGSLGWIDVHGETDTPNFVVDVGGHPFPLHATYHTIVDGTNGDTRLEQIDATFLKSSLVAKGEVLDGPPGHGRTVSLDVQMTNARLEDIMVMAVRTPKPPMVGALKLTTKFLLPPGETDVVDRLRLNGRFDISAAKFTNDTVQRRIVELSRRGRGQPGDQSPGQVASDFRGRFMLGGGRLDLRDLAFAVPGAQVRLSGHYALKPETLDFKGNLLIDAKVSQTVTGFKSLLLKIIDPLFARPGGGSSVPIKIEGTRSDPKFGLDRHRVFNRGNGS
ncbi:MAG TPA: AsmA-like C-terminal region-containing protein [Vicinamibacterales bacterium]